jgi:hypothetical protein
MPMKQTNKKYRPRHDKWLWRQAERFVCKMEVHGLYLHLQYRWYGPHWFLSDGTHIEPEIAEAVSKDRRVEAVGGRLFAGMQGQTWRWVGN